MTTRTYVHSSRLTVEQACETWLLSKHALKPSTLQGHRVALGPLRDELGHVEIQKLSKADLDRLVGRLRRGEVEGRKKWSARSVNYMLYLCSAVLHDQVAQGNVVRNVAKLVDRLAGEAAEMRTLTEKNMFAILDHEMPRPTPVGAGPVRAAPWRDCRAPLGERRSESQDCHSQREPGGRGQRDPDRHTQVEGQHADAADARRGGRGARQRGVHAVGVRAQPGRRAAGGGASFGRVVMR